MSEPVRVHPSILAMQAEVERLKRRIRRSSTSGYSPLNRMYAERIAIVEHRIERTLAKHARRDA